MGTQYQVRLELDEPVSRGPKADEIRRQLLDYQPVLKHNAYSKTEITLHVTSLDIWSSLLVIMAALKQVWYEPCAVEFIRYDELERRAS